MSERARKIELSYWPDLHDISGGSGTGVTSTVLNKPSGSSKEKKSEQQASKKRKREDTEEEDSSSDEDFKADDTDTEDAGKPNNEIYCV